MIFDHEGQGKYMIQNIGDRLYFYVGNENYYIAVTDSLHNAAIKGSPLHAEYAAFLDKIGGDFIAIMDEASKTAASIDREDPQYNEKMTAMREKYDTILENRRQKELELAKNNPNSIFSAEALRYVNYYIAVTDSVHNAAIKGSPLHAEYAAFLDKIGGDFIAIMDEASQTAASIDREDPQYNEKMTALREKYDTILENRRQKELEFAKNNPNSIFSAEALRY